MNELFFAPFTELDFMTRALVASMAIAVVGAPVGVLLMFRRLSLVGDALGHALLPGAALGYLMWGLYFPALFFGGLIAGLTVAGLASLVAQISPQKEESSLASMYLLSIATGVVLVSRSGSSVDLMHLLFGSVLALDEMTLYMVLGASVVALLLWAFLGRLLLFEALDAAHLERLGYPVKWIHFVFLFIVVLTLVTGFQALGTLMALGLVLLPSAAARFCVDSLPKQVGFAAVFGIVGSYCGLLASFHFNWPSGPAIVLCCGVIYLAALILGPAHGLWPRLRKPRHRPHPGVTIRTGVVVTRGEVKL